MSISKTHPFSMLLLTVCGVWLVGLGLYFLFLRPPLLPEDLRFMGTTLAQVQATVPGLERWLTKVFMVLGGFMASAGVLTVFVARAAIPARLQGTSWVIALSGTLSVALMSVINFSINSDFKWGLLIPALVWLASLGLYASGISTIFKQ